MPHTPVDRLTPRQEEVLALIARGRTNGEIATMLGISLDGAKYHVAEVLSRLGVDSRAEAADYWRSRNGLVPRLRRFVPSLALATPLRLAVAALVVFAGAILGLLVLLRIDDEPPPADPATTVTPPPASSLGKFAYAIEAGPDRGIYLAEVDGSSRLDLLDGVALSSDWRGPVVFALDGSHVAFVAETGDTAASISIVTLSTGPDRSVAEYPVSSPPSSLSWSPGLDRIVFAAATPDGQSDVYTLSLIDGDVRNLTANEFLDTHPEWSPDGSMIAFTSCRGCGAFTDVWVMAADGSGQRNLTPEPADRAFAYWSPDSRRVAFWSAPAGASGLYVADVRTGELRRAGPMLQGSAIAWLPDGERLVTTVGSADEGLSLGVADLRTGSSSRLLLEGSEGPGSSPLAAAPSGEFVAFAVANGIAFVDTTTGAYRLLRLPATPLHLAWLPLEPGPGVEPATLPAPIVQPKFTGDFPAPAPAEVDAAGWPILDCPAGDTTFRAETRRFVMCVPAAFVPGNSAEYTQDGTWGWVGAWSRGEVGDVLREQFTVQLLEREHSGSRSGLFHGCPSPRQGSFLGVPAHVCVLGDGDDLGTFSNEPWRWRVSVFAETPAYFLLVDGMGTQDGAAADEAVDRLLAALESARIGDPDRVIR